MLFRAGQCLDFLAINAENFTFPKHTVQNGRKMCFKTDWKFCPNSQSKSTEHLFTKLKPAVQPAIKKTTNILTQYNPKLH